MRHVALGCRPACRTHALRTSVVCVMALLSSVVCPTAQTRAVRTLDIYIVDVEGGNATLLVSPSRESVLIDSGNAGAAAVRDAERIMAAVKDAQLSQIDNLITTHWHGDHFGGLPNSPRESRSGISSTTARTFSRLPPWMNFCKRRIHYSTRRRGTSSQDPA